MSNLIGPFSYASSFRCPICCECQYAVLPGHIKAHLTDHHGGRYSAPVRRDIRREIEAVWDVVQSREEIDGILKAREPHQPQEPLLPHPKQDGFACHNCHFVAGTVRGIQRHCQAMHQWENPQAPGRVLIPLTQREVPWRSGVRYQRLFRRGVGLQLFEVERAAEGKQITLMTTTTTKQPISTIHELEQADYTRVTDGSSKLEPNLWLNNVGWARHFRGCNAKWIYSSVRKEWPPHLEPLVQEGMPKVEDRILRSLDRLFNVARRGARASQAGDMALIELSRRSLGRDPEKKFGMEMEKATWKRYTEILRRVFRYLIRYSVLADRPDDVRFPQKQLRRGRDDDAVQHSVSVEQRFSLTRKQNLALDNLIEQAQEPAEADRERDVRARVLHPAFLPRIDHLTMAFFLTLLQEQLHDKALRSPLLSALAAQGMKANGGWLTADEYTSTYSGFIKMARGLVLLKAHWLRSVAIDDVQDKEGLDREEAEDAAPSLLSILRPMVQQFMVLTHGENTSGPMAWIFHKRAYGMRVRSDLSSNRIGWDGEEALVKDVRISRDGLARLVAELIREATRELLWLLYCQDESELPAVQLEEVFDDHASSRPADNFVRLSESRRRGLTIEGDSWLASRVHELAGRPGQRGRIYEHRSSTRYTGQFIKEYSRRVQGFLERLLVLMHITGGQPARSTEIIPLRITNSPYGGLRNIFMFAGHAFFVTHYYKGMFQWDATKTVYRFLPREVTRLLVFYTWLVRPFRIALALQKDGGDRVSHYLWPRSFTGHGGQAGRVQPSPGGIRDKEASEEDSSPLSDMASLIDESEGSNEDGNVKRTRKRKRVTDAAQKQQSWDRPWPDTRLSVLLKEYSTRLIGVALPVSLYRHVAIAMARRYVPSQHLSILLAGSKGLPGRNGGGEDGSDSSESDLGDLRHLDTLQLAIERQSAHTAKVGVVRYGGDTSLAPFMTGSLRDKFFQATQAWHIYVFRLEAMYAWLEAPAATTVQSIPARDRSRSSSPEPAVSSTACRPAPKLDHTDLFVPTPQLPPSPTLSSLPSQLPPLYLALASLSSTPSSSISPQESGSPPVKRSRHGFRRTVVHSSSSSNGSTLSLGNSSSNNANNLPGSGYGNAPPIQPQHDLVVEQADRERERRHVELACTHHREALCQLLDGDLFVEFRGAQHDVIRALSSVPLSGEMEPILHIAGTGSGKSMAFLLPAFIDHHGVQIVLLPLLALIRNMLRRCAALGIPAIEWTRETEYCMLEGVPLVFLTPERFCSAACTGLLQRLLADRRLDRIFLDECHMVLEANSTWRPSFLGVAEQVKAAGVQLICLTATLPPSRMGDLVSLLPGPGTTILERRPFRFRVFREPTYRRIIHYQVRHVPIPESEKGTAFEQDNMLPVAVATTLRAYWVAHPRQGKVMIFCTGSLKEGRAIAEAVGCPFYHAKAEAGADIIKAWERQGGPLVATSALSMGIDYPDIVLVIHAGVPSDLASFSQETGRAGRWEDEGDQGGDVRRPAHSIVVVLTVEGRIQDLSRGTPSTQWFLSTPGCRRFALESFLDGDEGRRDSGCQDGEAACDNCQKRLDKVRAGEERPFPVIPARHYQNPAGIVTQLHSSKREELAAAAKQAERRAQKAGADYIRLCRQEEATRQQQRRDQQQVGQEIYEMREDLAFWEWRCPYCCLLVRSGRQWEVEPDQHEAATCTAFQQSADVVRSVKEIEEVFNGKRMEATAGCFRCGVPQAWCNRWVDDEDGGWREDVTGRCQFARVMPLTIATGIKVIPGAREELARMRQSSIPRTRSQADWYGTKRRFQGVEMTEMCRCFLWVARELRIKTGMC